MRRVQAIGDQIWLCEGDIVNFYGFPYPTRMIIVRLPDQKLWIWSPIKLDAQLKEDVSTLGPVGHLVSPNKIHHLYLGEWKQAFPEALIWGAASTINKRKELTFEPPLRAWAPAAWGDAIEVFHFTGSPFMDELVFFHRSSCTAILADLSENFSKEFVQEHWKSWQAYYAKYWGILSGKAPLEWRLSFFNKRRARGERDRLISKNPVQVIMAHGEWQRQNGKAFLQKSLSWLG